MASDYRIAIGITRAERSRTLFPKPRPSNPAARKGLTYERKVGRELDLHTRRGNFVKTEHNPWFTFYDEFGSGNCSPDFLLYLENGIVVVEVKLTWVEVALAKLAELYCPVVSVALGMPTRPLVICHNLTPYAPRATLSLREAIASPNKPLLWPSNGRILW